MVDWVAVVSVGASCVVVAWVVLSLVAGVDAALAESIACSENGTAVTARSASVDADGRLMSI